MERYEYYRVEASGELVDLDEFPEKSNEVYIVVDNDERLIMLWKGLEAGVRQKFIGSRATGEKRKDLGYHYNIEVMDEDDLTDNFIKYVLGGEVEEKPTISSASDDSTETEYSSYAEAAKAQGIDLSDDEIAEKDQTDSSTPSHISKMGGVGARPQKSFLSDPNFYKDVAEDKETREKVTGMIQETNKEDALKLITALPSPKGFDREMLIVGNRVYRVNTETEEPKLDDLDNPLDGVIMVKEYTPRILAENGRVKAVELLKQTSEDIDLEDELTQDLEDLTSMFQIEIA